jgi:endonuclease/exonuclease/phosphatase family metal-dependent hydrolase
MQLGAGVMKLNVDPAWVPWISFAVWVAMANCAGAQPVETLRVMTFNVWTGEGSAAGRSKLVEIIQAAEADIVGLQEVANNAGQEMASTLGFHYHQQSASDIQILSRYPIVGQSPANLGARIELTPGQHVWLFNAHLAAYPYQPYDLRDGSLPQEESAVIAAANAARGSQVTNYLSDMTTALASGDPVFFTGDFNEPSHLDWTQAAAAATARPFDLKVEYPASKRITAAGMTDSFRAVRPDEVNDTAYTWTPGYPPPNLTSDEVHDRIDLIYHRGPGVLATGASTLGLDAGDPNTDIGVPGYNADHRAVVVAFELPPTCSVPGDFDENCALDADDWAQFRGGQHADLTGLTPQAAYQMGDLNGDFLNNHADFVLFKDLFERVHGPGSLASMLARVPEPSTAALLPLIVLGWAGRLGRAARPVVTRTRG